MSLPTALSDPCYHDDEAARLVFEAIQWPDGATCPHCGLIETVAPLGGKSMGPGWYWCSQCREKFTVRVGSVMERSHIPMHKWLLAFRLLNASKKGMSAHQLHRMLGVAYRTAWFMAHRIREAMKREPLVGLLHGTVEVDETYVGGKPRPEAGAPKAKRGRGTKKTPVVALVERNGRVRARKIDRVDGVTLKGAIRENVDRKARIMTDEWSAYRGIGSEFAGGHQTVNHGIGEYARGDVFTNTAESFFALLKRGVVGSFHHISKQHLDRYCDEFSFRWDYRSTTDSDRTAIALRQTKGKRLTYRRPDQPQDELPDF
jgi:transposase-like protein